MSAPTLEKINGFENKLKFFNIFRGKGEKFLSSVTLAYVNDYDFCNRALLQFEDGKVCEIVQSHIKRPREFPNLRNINIKLVSGSLSSLLLLSQSGHLYNRGSLPAGMYDPDTFYPLSPSVDLSRVRKMRCGAFHVALLTEDGQVYSWMANDKGQRGLTHEDYARDPEMVMTNVEDMDVGWGFTVALTTKGSVYLWGTVYREMEYPEQTELRINGTVKSISCGRHHVLLLTQTGSVYSMGYNRFGPCGVGDGDFVKQLKEICNVKAENVYTDHLSWFSSCVTTQQKILVWGWLRTGNEAIVKSTPIPKELDVCVCEPPCDASSKDSCEMLVIMKDALKRYDDVAEVREKGGENKKGKFNQESSNNGTRNYSLRKRNS